MNTCAPTTESTNVVKPWEILAPTGSQTQDLRCYRGSCNH
jgi:hypothetical protein